MFRSENINQDKVLSYVWSMILIIGVWYGMIFSPQISFWCAILLIITKVGNVSLVRNTLVIISLLMILFTTTSRSIGVSNSDDLIGTYMPIVQTQIDHLGVFGTWMGIEIGYGLYFNIILNFFNELTPRVVMFFSVLFSLFFYFIWLMFFLLKHIEYKYRGVVLAISISFIQVGLLSQFLRQEMATPLLLIAIFSFLERKYILTAVFLTSATLLHSTSLIIFLLFLFFDKYTFKTKIIFFLAYSMVIGVLRFKVSVIISLLSAIHLSVIGNKLTYYSGMESIPLFNVISSGKFFILIIAMCILNYKKLDVNKIAIPGVLDKVYAFCFFSSLYSLPLLVLPNASRLFLIAPGFLFGVVMLMSFKRKMSYVIIFFVFFCLVSILFPQRLNGGVNEGFELWQHYDWYSSEPFYYLDFNRGE